jgi:aurora kinase
LKVLYIDEIKQNKVGKQVRREIEIQSNLKRPNILVLYGRFHYSKRIFQILEFAGKGDSSKHLRLESRFPEWKAAQYVAQVAAALRYMHRKHVMHRNLKPENLLIGIHGEIKISDFGSSIHKPIKKRTTFQRKLDYLSPEIIKVKSQDTSYGKEVDLWALGVLKYEFLVGKAPFDGTQVMTQRRIAEGQITVPSFVSPEAKDLIEGLSC